MRWAPHMTHCVQAVASARSIGAEGACDQKGQALLQRQARALRSAPPWFCLETLQHQAIFNSIRCKKPLQGVYSGVCTKIYTGMPSAIYRSGSALYPLHRMVESWQRGYQDTAACDPEPLLQVLPKGSITLATSQTGSTLYMEPKPVMQLNNAASQLAYQVRTALQL